MNEFVYRILHLCDTTQSGIVYAFTAGDAYPHKACFGPHFCSRKIAVLRWPSEHPDIGAEQPGLYANILSASRLRVALCMSGRLRCPHTCSPRLRSDGMLKPDPDEASVHSSAGLQVITRRSAMPERDGNDNTRRMEVSSVKKWVEIPQYRCSGGWRHRPSQRPMHTYDIRHLRVL